MGKRAGGVSFHENLVEHKDCSYNDRKTHNIPEDDDDNGNYNQKLQQENANDRNTRMMEAGLQDEHNHETQEMMEASSSSAPPTRAHKFNRTETGKVARFEKADGSDPLSLIEKVAKDR